MNLQDNQESSEQLLSNFNLTNSQLNSKARQALEKIPVKLHDVIVPHRFDLGIKKDSKVRPTPIDENQVYIQNLKKTNQLGRRHHSGTSNFTQIG